MTRDNLFEEIKRKKSFLCIGLDSDINKIPAHLLDEEDPIFEFNKQIIDATKGLCVAYKPNIAFYESLGAKGWKSLEKTLAYIPSNIFTIADAKRGDIGNTSELYAKTFYETFAFDSVTLAPYMGKDSVSPFLNYSNKWVILLALTSNQSAADFQTLKLADVDMKLYEKVLHESKGWGNENNLMYVVGATKSEMIKEIRSIIPDHFLLVPGVGAQGGSLEEVVEYGINNRCGLLINSSRGIIYAGSGTDFKEEARVAAHAVQQKMQYLLTKHGLLE